jgi:hypothetical protein
VAKAKRTIWDELVEIGNEIMDKVDEVMNPQKKKPARVPVPVPARSNGRRPQPYDQPR